MSVISGLVREYFLYVTKNFKHMTNTFVKFDHNCGKLECQLSPSTEHVCNLDLWQVSKVNIRLIAVGSSQTVLKCTAQLKFTVRVQLKCAVEVRS